MGITGTPFTRLLVNAGYGYYGGKVTQCCFSHILKLSVGSFCLVMKLEGCSQDIWIYSDTEAPSVSPGPDKAEEMSHV